MLKLLKKITVATLSTMLLTLALLAPSASAAPITQTPAVEIQNATASPNPVDFKAGESLNISYDIDSEAYITLNIYKKIATDSYTKVAQLLNEQLQSIGTNTIAWDGTQTGGDLADPGTYYFGLSAEGLYNPEKAYTSEWIYVVDGSTSINNNDDLEIVDVDLAAYAFDPKNNEEMELDFTINKRAYITLKITNQEGATLKTLKDEVLYEAGTSTISWDGRDYRNEYLTNDTYKYELSAEIDGDRDSKKGSIEIETAGVRDRTDDPRIKDAYLTKENFDPGRESTYIVFNLTARADLSITIEDMNGQEYETIYDKNNQEAGLYKIEWDGSELTDNEGDYELRIDAENTKGEDQKFLEVTIEDDEVSGSRPNVLKDKIEIEDIPFSLENDDNLAISFRLDKKTEVTVEIMDNNYLIETLVEDHEYPAGLTTVKWDGKDQFGDYIDEGIYQYKITATNAQGKDEEEGNFSLTDSSLADGENVCAGFTDVSDTHSLCDSITWAKNMEIFEGYQDGSFRPNQAITRTEALKVILLTLDVNILSADGSNYGFSDVEKYGWYAGYLRTAINLGIAEGYQDGKFRPANQITKAEGLKILLETGRIKDDVIIPSLTSGLPYEDAEKGAWYIKYLWMAKEHNLSPNAYYFSPNEALTRAEMADMLYRYYNSDLT
ncbi:S-layer homology domain-containing protein [Patescibacteria group bacterium]|nr:S-layer homology domain-containing protein [Patescibacteria group bacterium]